MDIQRAKKLEVGQFVTCPPDRGEPGYRGIVIHIAPTECENFKGVPYIWVTVKHPTGKRSTVWPSNRLG